MKRTCQNSKHCSARGNQEGDVCCVLPIARDNRAAPILGVDRRDHAIDQHRCWNSEPMHPSAARLIARWLIHLKVSQDGLAQKTAEAGCAIGGCAYRCWEVDLNAYLTPPKIWIVAAVRPKISVSQYAMSRIQRGIAGSPRRFPLGDSAGDRGLPAISHRWHHGQ